MKIAVTGATGFLGRYIVATLLEAGHELRCWFRSTSDRGGFATTPGHLEWQPGQLGDAAAAERLVVGCDAVVHAALDHPGAGFRGAEGELIGFVETNLVGTLRLVEAARAARVGRFVFISTCAVHEKILAGRPLDETHPLWPTSHYGAHKAAIEKFIHSYGFGMGYPICALRPTGIYGVAHPAGDSRWFDLVRQVVRGEAVTCSRGGKEVHAADVAKAVEVLLSVAADKIAGEAFNCCDGYVSEWEAATLAQELSGSRGEIKGKQTAPKHEIVTDKLRSLGMQFGGREILRQTIGQLVEAAKAEITAPPDEP